MANYIMDLRNTAFVLVIISVVGICGFLLLRIVSRRSARKRQQQTVIRNVKETVPTGYYYQSQLAPEPCERMRTLMNQSEIDSDPFETSADAIESNGTLHSYVHSQGET
ncbi:hypothetical protein GCK32_017420 [Trichostrongylus colubriformis]|uniref:Uncharacterized protein n=1 Tax=Trichostrongylus colubriformis TaxID=6319 RepID=A0AAN8IU13_TRICO